MEDIHPNLPPIAPSFLTQFDWIVIVILVCGLLYVLWLYARSKEKGKSNAETQKKPISKSTPTFSQSMRGLQKLKESEKWKEFALKATVLLKSELTKRFHEDFEFATGSEIHALLKEKGASKVLLENVQILFVTLDPVKFAKAKTKDDIAQNVINILRSIHSSSKSTRS